MVAGMTVAKYGFISLIMTGAGFFIANMAVLKHIKTSDLVYRPSHPLSYESLTVLDKDFSKCLIDPTKSFCLLSLNKRLELFKSKNYPEPPSLEQIKNRLNNITALRRKEFAHPLYSLIGDFSKLMKSLDIEIVLLEPSMLFCMLSPSKKLYLMTEGYHPRRLEGSHNVVTFGIFEDEALVFDEEEVIDNMTSMGFAMSTSRKSIKMWNWDERKYESISTIGHYLFTRRQLMAHVVVFYRRGDFLWHAGLPREKIGNNNLLFHQQGSYDNFTQTSLDIGENSLTINIPADPLYFLLQIETSKFLNCTEENKPAEDESATKHPTLTNDQLRVRAVITLGELKAILFPETTPFWLWSESLLGWYKHCDIFRFSADLHFAVAWKTLQDFNFTDRLTGNEYITVTEENSDSKYKLDCHGLSVNIYIAHEDGNEVWHEERSDDSTAHSRLVYAKFSLCSTDILGYKINVPCVPEKIFEAEYGASWENDDFKSSSYKINRSYLNKTEES